jgi:hypothetical protein
MVRSRHTAAASILIGLLALTPTQALAKSKADALERAAKKACASGEVAKGVDILSDLYVQTDDSTYIFNQGRCYEQNHEWTRAIDRFREFILKNPNTKSDAKVDAEKHIADCKGYLSEEGRKPLPPPTRPC